ncbi:MAG: hypothetical protein Alpg2KO_03780 [Alphaproteobacteria bacterium]
MAHFPTAEREAALATAGQALQDVGLGVPDTLLPLSDQGECNIALGAEYTGRRVVVRLNRDRASDEFAKEHWCLGVAQEAGLSVPQSLGFGQSDGWNYAIHSDGGRTPALQSGAKSQIKLWRWLGQQASLLQGIHVSGFGEKLEAGTDGHFTDIWDSYLTGNLAALPEEAVAFGLPAKDTEWLAQRLKQLEQGNHSIGLCHGDLSLRNVVINEAGQPCLIDWGCAHAHVAPQYDLWEVLRQHGPDSPECAAFLEGLGICDRDDQIQKTCQALDVLLLCAFDLMRWARDRAPDKLLIKRRDFEKVLQQSYSIAGKAG